MTAVEASEFGLLVPISVVSSIVATGRLVIPAFAAGGWHYERWVAGRMGDD